MSTRVLATGGEVSVVICRSDSAPVLKPAVPGTGG